MAAEKTKDKGPTMTKPSQPKPRVRWKIPKPPKPATVVYLVRQGKFFWPECAFRTHAHAQRYAESWGGVVVRFVEATR